MGTSDRSRKPREMVAPREEPESVPPPARRRRVRNELDPEMLWDKETDEQSEEYEVDDEGFGEKGDEESSDDNFTEDLDDWDHPIRRLKIN
jgi:phosphopantothenoylcysteine synthetase/decarboxylase